MAISADSTRNLLNRILADERLSQVHQSMLLALFAGTGANTLQRPLAITRRKLMKHSRIRSTATYHKCLKELSGFGYIRYEPSYHPGKGSRVWVL